MTDPICGMSVDAEHAACSHVHNGQTYYFCSQHCLAKFTEDPEKFLKPPSAEHAAHGHGHAHAHMPAQPPPSHPAAVAYVCPIPTKPDLLDLKQKAI